MVSEVVRHKRVEVALEAARRAGRSQGRRHRPGPRAAPARVRGPRRVPRPGQRRGAARALSARPRARSWPTSRSSGSPASRRRPRAGPCWPPTPAARARPSSRARPATACARTTSTRSPRRWPTPTSTGSIRPRSSPTPSASRSSASRSRCAPRSSGPPRRRLVGQDSFRVHRVRPTPPSLPALIPGACVVAARLPGRRLLPGLVGAARGRARRSRWRCGSRSSSGRSPGFSAWSGVAAGALALFGAWILLSAGVVARARPRAGRVRPAARLPARARPVRVAGAARAPAGVGAARRGAGDRRHLRGRADHAPAPGHLRQRGQRLRAPGLPAHLLERPRDARRRRRDPRAAPVGVRAASRGRCACWPPRCRRSRRAPSTSRSRAAGSSPRAFGARASTSCSASRARRPGALLAIVPTERLSRSCTAYDAELLVDDDTLRLRRRPARRAATSPRRSSLRASSPRSRCARSRCCSTAGARRVPGPGRLPVAARVAASRPPSWSRSSSRRWPRARRPGPTARSTCSSNTSPRAVRAPTRATA